MCSSRGAIESGCDRPLAATLTLARASRPSLTGHVLYSAARGTGPGRCSPRARRSRPRRARRPPWRYADYDNQSGAPCHWPSLFLAKVSGRASRGMGSGTRHPRLWTHDARLEVAARATPLTGARRFPQRAVALRAAGPALGARPAREPATRERTPARAAHGPAWVRSEHALRAHERARPAVVAFERRDFVGDGCADGGEADRAAGTRRDARGAAVTPGANAEAHCTPQFIARRSSLRTGLGRM